MSPVIFRTRCMFKLSMTVLLRSVTAIRVVCQRSLTCMLRRGSRGGTTRLTTLRSRLTNQCSRIDSKSLEVAIRDVGHSLNVGRVLSVTYDVPEDGPEGMYHLHLSICLIRVEDEVL